MAGTAMHRTSAAPVATLPAAQSACVTRWSGLLAVAIQTGFAASLLEPPSAGECNVGGVGPNGLPSYTYGNPFSIMESVLRNNRHQLQVACI